MHGLTCKCGTVYFARAADIRRGWGKSCSKRCAAIKRAENSQKKLDHFPKFDISIGSRAWNEASLANEMGWDAHKF